MNKCFSALLLMAFLLGLGNTPTFAVTPNASLMAQAAKLAQDLEMTDEQQVQYAQIMLQRQSELHAWKKENQAALKQASIDRKSKDPQTAKQGKASLQKLNRERFQIVNKHEKASDALLSEKQRIGLESFKLYQKSIAPYQKKKTLTDAQKNEIKTLCHETATKIKGPAKTKRKGSWKWSLLKQLKKDVKAIAASK